MGLENKLFQAASEIYALLNYANGVTGSDDVRLGDAVRTLAEGFGGGSGSAWDAQGTFDRTLGIYQQQSIINHGLNLSDTDVVIVFVIGSPFWNRSQIQLCSKSQLGSNAYGICTTFYNNSSIQDVVLNSIDTSGTVGTNNATLYWVDPNTFAMSKGSQGGIGAGTYKWFIKKLTI